MALRSFFIIFVFAGLSFAASFPRARASAPSLTPNGKKGFGTVHLPITQKKGLAKRQDPTSFIFNYNTFYLIQITIGNPPQSIDVSLDTGSSELWVNPYCPGSFNPTICDALPRYDPTTSSTAVDQDATFDISYGTGDVEGEYWRDTVTLAGVNVTTQQFGVAQTGSFAIMGILGVGLGYGFGYPGETEYYYYYEIIDRLFVEGFIESRAFGLNLGSPALSEGSIDFGGIDTGKYIGSLYKSAMIPWDESPDGTPRYWFYLTSIGVTQPGNSTSTLVSGPEYAQPMFPDCGATLSQLPPSLFDAIIQFFPTAVDDGTGVYEIDCSILDEPGTIDFGFGTKIINVPYSAWFRPSGSTCIFGGVSNPNVFSLGDTFMRSAYIVYDQDNFNIHIAQGADCGSNVIPIGSGVDAVPSVAGQCTAASSTSSSSSVKTSTSSSSVKTSSSSKVSTTTSSSKSSTKTTSSVLSSTSKSSTSSSVKPTSTSSSKASIVSTSSSLTSTSKSSTSSTVKLTSTSSTKTSTKSTSSSSTTTSKSSTTSNVKPTSTSSTKSSSKSSSITSTSSKSSSLKSATASSTKASSNTSSSKSSTASSTKTSSTSSSKSSSTSKSSTTSKSSSTTKSTTGKGPTTTFK